MFCENCGAEINGKAAIYVRCTAAGSGLTVNISSKCVFPLQLIAWGKHDRNISAIKKLLSIP